MTGLAARWGDHALPLGVLALLLSLLPVVGDLAAVPVALAALWLGLAAFAHEDAGPLRTCWRPLLGALVAAATLLTVLLTLAAMGMPG